MTSSLSKSWITLSIASALTGGLLFGVTAASASNVRLTRLWRATDRSPARRLTRASPKNFLGNSTWGRKRSRSPITTSACASLEIVPGGEVAWHSHDDRPALIYVVSGTITEYASTCSVPIVHEAGDLSIESHLSHWWKNTSAKPVVLISADIAADPKDHNM